MQFSGRKRAFFSVGVSLIMLAIIGFILLQTHAVLANHIMGTQPATTGVLASGSRNDVTTNAIPVLGTVDPSKIPQATALQHSAVNVPLKSRWTGPSQVPAQMNPLHSIAPTASPSLAPQSIPNTPLPTSGFLGQSQTSAIPSDMGLVAGNGFVMQFVNSTIAVYDTSGHLQAGWPKTSQAFFGVPATNLQFDPRMVFDPINSRFIALVDDAEGTSINTYAAHYYIAVSATTNPNGLWHTYAISVAENLGTANATWADFPQLGIDAIGLYFTGNRYHFPVSTGTFVHAFVGFLNRAQIEAGGSITYREFNNLTTSNGQAFTVAPAVQNGMNRAEIMVDTDFNCATAVCNTYDVWSLADPTGPAPKLSYVKITGPNWSVAPLANQPGTNGTNSIATMDPRVAGQAVWRTGTLSFAITTGYNNGSGTNVAAAEWVQFGVALNTGDAHCGALPNRCVDITSAMTKDSGIVGYAGATDAFDPALAVDSDGNFLMTFTYSSSTRAPIMAIISHRDTEPLGKIATPAQTISLGQTVGFWSNKRWGDYSAVAIDPASCTPAGCFRLWYGGMFGMSTGKWGTVIGATSYDITQP